jgi:hypothetical protein
MFPEDRDTELGIMFLSPFSARLKHGLATVNETLLIITGLTTDGVLISGDVVSLDYLLGNKYTLDITLCYPSMPSAIWHSLDWTQLTGFSSAQLAGLLV